ncbi:diguanylate cyclase [Paraburkholderia edwinii]|uniref:Diguanylate cyclase n=1 Tax=Paraburkholderia edwinii TaxID=2861782 RepID=A0ABX8UJU8_9BURK|nr:diguanylate cyclase [Paraburkholderia edwinii]
MPARPSMFNFLLDTPASGNGQVTASIRASLLSTLFENTRPLLMSGLSSAFVAVVACFRVHHAWAPLWLAAEILFLAARMTIAHLYVARNRVRPVHPEPSAARYAPVSLLACLTFGLGTMASIISGDMELASLSLMVTAGILGGIASRNAALPRLAIMQIFFGTIPIGVGALLAPRSASWILVPPLFAYLVAMVSVVRRHYEGLVALMTAEQRHAELAARFDAALTHMPHGLCTIDGNGRVIVANRRAAELFGATVEMLRLNVPLPEFIGQVGVAKFGETLRKQLVERCTTWLSGERRPLDLDLGDGRQLEMTRNPVPDGSAVIIIEDVTERRQSEAKILHLARHDPLTGLPNRRDLYERLERILARSMGGREPEVALMYLDLDGFKQVNDRLGHHAGDEVLTAVAGRLKELLWTGEFVARLGGDEFAVVVENSTCAASEALAPRIIRELAKPYMLSTGEAISIGTSIGIAFAVHGESIEQLLKRADVALYDAKEAGKGTFRFSVPDSSRKEGAVSEPRWPAV